MNTRLIVQSRLGQDAAAWDFVASVQTAVQLVENAYWDLVYSLANLESKKEALDRANDFNRITKIKIDVGALAPIEIVQTEVTIAQREQEIILAEGQIGDAQDRLKRLLNVTDLSTWSRPIVPTDKPSEEKIAIDVEAGIRSAIEVRPEVKQALVNIESKKISVVYNRNELKPRLDARGAYGLSGVGFNNDVVKEGSSYSDAFSQIGSWDYPNWSIGLNFAIPLGNRTAKANAAIAATDLELATTNLALLKQNLSLEVRTAARNVDTARRSVAAAKKARELADRNLDAERKKFDNGMTTSFTVAQVQNDLTTARSNELLAIAGYLKSMVSWHRAVGDLLPTKNVEIAGLPNAMTRACGGGGGAPVTESEPGVAPAAPGGPDPGLSPFSALAGTFTSPANTFAGLVRRPTWWLPLLLWLVGIAVVVYVSTPKIDMERTFREMFEARAAKTGQSMSDQQIRELVARSDKTP